MFALTPSMSYYLCPHAVDMRKGIYSLYQLVKSDMGRNPLSGEVFLFLGKTRGMIKILHWQKDGFILYTKKLEKGTFEVPCFNPGSGQYEMKWATFCFDHGGGPAEVRKVPSAVCNEFKYLI